MRVFTNYRIANLKKGKLDKGRPWTLSGNPPAGATAISRTQSTVSPDQGGDIVKALTKFTGTLTGRQLFGKEKREEILAEARKLPNWQPNQQAAAFQTAFKNLWDAADDQKEWEERATTEYDIDA